MHELGLVDEIVSEPLGAAHRDYDATAACINEVLNRTLNELLTMEVDVLVAERQKRIRQYGFFNT